MTKADQSLMPWNINEGTDCKDHLNEVLKGFNS